MRRLKADSVIEAGDNVMLRNSYYNYDAIGELIQEGRAMAISGYTILNWQNWLISYTPTGQVWTKTDPLGNVTTNAYDADDRLITVTDPTNIVNGVAYDAAGEKTQECKAIGTPLQQGCQAAGQTPTPGYANYTYTLNGKVATESDARANAITYAYDGFDRLHQATYADGTFEQKAYDANANVLTLTTRRNLQIIDTYDALNRRITEQGWNPATGHNFYFDWWTGIRTSAFGYDLQDHLTSVTNDTWNLSWVYDVAGRVTSHTTGWMGATTTTYDNDNNPLTVTHSSGNVESFSYDGLNRMTSASLNGTIVASPAWDTLSRRTFLTYGDNSTVAYFYDNADRLNKLVHAFPNGTASNVSFTYGYDNAGRLTSESSTNSAFEDSPPAASTAYGAANSLNQYPTVGGQTLTYMADGSLYEANLSAEGTAFYEYDEKRELGEIAASSGGAFRIDHTDAIGRRSYLEDYYVDTSRYQQGFSFDGIRPEPRTEMAWTAAAGAGWVTLGWRDYVLGPNPDERLAFRDTNGTVYYPHTDRQGTTIALSTGGQDVLTRTYGPYGETRQPVTPGPGASSYPYLYTGQHYDSSFGGLYYYKARIYSPSTIGGRFLQPDPIGTKDDENLYGYTHNDPLNGTDPNGEATYYFHSDGTITVVQKFDNHSQFSNKQIQAQAQRYNGTTATGNRLSVQFVPGKGPDAVKITTNNALNDNGNNRSHTDGINGRNVEIAPNAHGADTVGHELGHTLGAGDQYKGGIDVSGGQLTRDVPGSQGSIMRDYGGKPADQQTRTEIQRNATEPGNTVKVCPTNKNC